MQYADDKSSYKDKNNEIRKVVGELTMFLISF